jgi:hypothetical protein
MQTLKIGLVEMDDFFERSGRFEVEGPVKAYGVVEGLDVVENHEMGLISGSGEG